MKDDPASVYRGMTVNEALVAAGLIDLWDAAIIDRRRADAIQVLAQVGLENQAETIVDTTMSDPARYGFVLGVSGPNGPRRRT